jgi:membrane fusion protein, multidrug efflux system
VIRLLKRALAVLVVGAVTGTVVYVSAMPSVQKQGGGGKRKMMGDGPVPVSSSFATVKDVPVYLNGVGTAKARNTVTVRPQVDGKILSINFKEGQDVKKGDVLARIDPATYQAQYDQAVAKKLLDETQLANAKLDLERYAKLTTLSVAQKTIDTQRALVAQLTAQIKQDEAAIANARAVLDYTEILSPIDGRTGIRMVDEGNLVRGADAASAIVVITEVRPIAAVFTLPQQQLAQVNAALASGGPLSVEALDADGRTVLDKGALQVVDNQVDPTTGTVRMKAEFPNANLQLWPGQFVNVRILIDTLKQVVVVPTPAVQRGPNGTFAYVVSTDEKVALRQIAVTAQTETQAVIAKGVSNGERVVTSGFTRLKDGTSVVLSEPEQPEGAGAQATATKSETRAKIRAACAADVQKFCAGVERSEIRACLQAKAAQLSPECKAAVVEGKAREADVRKAEGSSVQ